jgi:hypothetical protein
MLCDDLALHATSNCEKEYISALRKSCESLATQDASLSPLTIVIDANTIRRLEEYLTECQRYLKDFDTLLQTVVQSSHDIATTTQQCPRISALFWLQHLVTERYEALPEGWKSTIIAYALAITKLLRAQRLLAASKSPQDLLEELRNEGHSNWNAAELPEILLLEAESGIMIREVQMDIARQMSYPPKDRNSVMQLNMGEGKSSVIVPVVATTLGDKKRFVSVALVNSLHTNVLCPSQVDTRHRR